MKVNFARRLPCYPFPYLSPSLLFLFLPVATSCLPLIGKIKDALNHNNSAQTIFPGSNYLEVYTQDHGHDCSKEGAEVKGVVKMGRGLKLSSHSKLIQRTQNWKGGLYTIKEAPSTILIVIHQFIDKARKDDFNEYTKKQYTTRN